METLEASSRRVTRALPWLAVATAGAVAWSLAHREQPLDLLTATAAAGRAIWMLYVAAMWRRWRELATGVLVGLIGAMGWVGARLALGWLPGAAETIGAGGAALLPFLAYRARTREGEVAQIGGWVSRLALVYLLLTPLALTLAGATVVVLPRAWDVTAYAIDQRAFPVHSFHVGRALERWPWLRVLAEFAYEWIFRFLPALVALRIRLPRPPATDLLLVCVIVSVLGQLGYYVTPIVGPAFAFGDEFPDVLPHIDRLPMVALPVPPFLRNGMPSVHMAWGLVFLWNARPFAWPVRALAWFVMIFTVVSTLGLGQHYVIDLIAAVPYAVAAQAMGTVVSAERVRFKWARIATCLALALGWILCPRFAWDIARVPGLVIAAAAITVGVSLWFERWLPRGPLEAGLVDAAGSGHGLGRVEG